MTPIFHIIAHHVLMHSYCTLLVFLGNTESPHYMPNDEVRFIFVSYHHVLAEMESRCRAATSLSGLGDAS